VKLLNEQLKKILTGPGEAKLWQDRGLDVIASSPEDFAARLVNERKKWGDVIKKRGIKAE
jgi:tripartite-type tricarboxylate transporter receptor subunit TctC